MPERNTAIDDFLKRHCPRYTRTPLAGDASFRRYERIVCRDNNQTYVLMDAPPGREDTGPFMHIDHFLCEHGFSAPSIIASDAGNGLLLLEDLGDATYNRALKAGADEQTLYRHAVDVLIKLHGLTPPQKLKTHDYRALSEAQRFTEWYLPLLAGRNHGKGDKDYDSIWEHLLQKVGYGNVMCLYDYHADNLMWLPDRDGTKKVGLLDFQDAVIGSPALDLAALLQDIRRDVLPDTQEIMLHYFIEKTDARREEFLVQYAFWGAHWNTRIIGTFARLASRDKKKHYLSFLPTVWKRLEQNLEHPVLAPLKEWLDKNVPMEKRHAA